jgi:tRNA G18 (ribose-2'-O)-methylase SpoU
VVLVLGSEEHGLRPGVAAELDQRLRIPMRGRVESLNVAAAAAVLLLEAARSREEAATPSG